MIVEWTKNWFKRLNSGKIALNRLNDNSRSEYIHIRKKKLIDENWKNYNKEFKFLIIKCGSRKKTPTHLFVYLFSSSHIWTFNLNRDLLRVYIWDGGEDEQPFGKRSKTLLSGNDSYPEDWKTGGVTLLVSARISVLGIHPREFFYIYV